MPRNINNYSQLKSSDQDLNIRGVEFLGTSGTQTPESGTTCLRISEHCVIDAGNLIRGLGQDVFDIEHIFLSHSHLDHIVDIPFLTELFVTRKKTSLKIYGLAHTLNDLKDFIFNYHIWPNFEEIDLLQEMEKTIKFIEIEPEETYQIDDIKITPFKTVHTNGSCGFVVRHQDNAIIFTADTYRCDRVWELLNQDPSIHSLAIDVSFPSSYEKLAFDSKHLTPALLADERTKCARGDITIYPMHHKKQFEDTIQKELQELIPIGVSPNRLVDDTLIPFDPKIAPYKKEKDATFFSKIMMIGTALSSERNMQSLLELIISQTRLLTNADAGTLYLHNHEQKTLEFKVIQNDTLNINNREKNDVTQWAPLSMYDVSGQPNRNMASTVCAHDACIINLTDVYDSNEYDFSGTKQFDANTGYRSQSMLVVPLKDQDETLIGVLQLINKKSDYGTVIPFESKDETLALSVSSHAAVALTKQIRINDLESLLHTFIHSNDLAIKDKISQTIDHDKIHYKIESLKLQYEILKRDAQIVYLSSARTPEDAATLQSKLDSLERECELLIATFNKNS